MRRSGAENYALIVTECRKRPKAPLERLVDLTRSCDTEYILASHFIADGATHPIDKPTDLITGDHSYARIDRYCRSLRPVR